MSSRSAKRARNASDNSTVGHDVRESDIPSLVESLDVNTMARLLIVAAKAYPTIASLVENETGRIAAVERARVVDFNYLSKDAWKTLNVTYDRLRDSHAYEMKHCPETASFETKQSALETLRNIGKSICLSNGVIGHEVRKQFQWGGNLVPVMMDVAMSLAEYEKEILRPWCEEKLEELREVAEGYCILEDLDEVIRSWLGEEGEDEDKDEDECDSEVETGIDVDTSGYR